MEKLNERLINYLLDTIEKRDKEIRGLKHAEEEYKRHNLWLSKEIKDLQKII